MKGRNFGSTELGWENILIYCYCFATGDKRESLIDADKLAAVSLWDIFGVQPGSKHTITLGLTPAQEEPWTAMIDPAQHSNPYCTTTSPSNFCFCCCTITPTVAARTAPPRICR